MSEKLKLLLLAANSVDTIDSRATDEIQAIDRAIQSAPFRDRFDVQKEPALRVSDIGPSLLKHRPDILHISAHSRKREGLILENELGEVVKVRCSQLKDILFSAGSNLQFISYGFCYSAECAGETSTKIDAVLGIQDKIWVKSSLAFFPALFEALASGHSIQAAVDYGKSILGVKKLPGANAIVLEARDGVDVTKSLLTSTTKIDELKTIFERVIRSGGSELDRSILQRERDNVIVVLGHQDAEGTDADLPVRFTGNAGILQANLNPESYRKIREALYPVPPGIAPPLPPPVFLGREDALGDIRRLVTTNRGPNQENITVVRGWPGVGKTSMVSALGHDTEIIRTFRDGVLWISLEQKPNVIAEMARWGRALGSEEILKAVTVKDATAQLAALLSEKNMLLIVDDVWETGDAVAFTGAAGEQCSVMVTTRLTKVADALTTQTYILPVLTEEFALEVLRRLAREVVSQNEDECLELVRDLECLPLALHVAAGLLRSEARLGWGVSELIEKIRTGTELIDTQAPKDRIEKDGVIPSVKVLLQRSTDVLDELTRERFIFLGGFAPKPTMFDLPALRAVWEVDDPRPTVRELAEHGLLEPVGGGRFQMHRILVDHARSLSIDD
ncbi:MAG TPA: NB-ARC domain-containing protein [Pyrinomonadaceae bacterium]|nr:NB-ARC domain-containing protein [Pyrinomonadaceae bacterium]